MSSIIEVVRQYYEDIEVQQKRILDEMLLEPKMLKERILRDATIASRMKTISESAKKILEHYEDPDGIRAAELRELGSATPMVEFRKRFESIMSYHEKFERNAALIEAESSKHNVKLSLHFSHLENGGRMVDLSSFYNRFCNLQFYKTIVEFESNRTKDNDNSAQEESAKSQETIVGQENQSIEAKSQTITEVGLIPYLTFLSIFEEVSEIFSRKMKISASPGVLQEYLTYLTDINSYFCEFFAKFQPLVPVAGLISIMMNNFEQDWASKKVTGWFADVPLTRPSKEIPGRSTALPAIFLKFNATQGSLADDFELSEETLKANPLFCVACDKLFAKQPMYDQHLTGKKHIKAVKAMESQTSESTQKEPSKESSTSAGSIMQTIRNVAKQEYMLVAWSDLLRSQINEAIFFTEMKQTKSHKEMLAELAAMESGEIDLSDEDIDQNEIDEKERARRANPHNVPLGPDGQPIPYWLYKLHGLNIYYSCEICGDYKYRGERQFYKHFKEARHTNFLRLLGIPNSDHFTNIVKIEDAKKLHEKLLLDSAKTDFNEDNEEVQDTLGNSYTASEYRRLKETNQIL